MNGLLTPELPAPRRGGHSLALAVAFAATLLPATLLPPAAAGDDTELFRESTAEPYVFFLLDVSGSMNQSVPCSAEQAKAGECGNVTCTQAQIDAGTCSVYCPTGACLPRMMGDDAFSRFGVAKEAIYEIARRVDDVNFGFGQFGRSGMEVRRKHWWYGTAADQTPGGSPPAGFDVGTITLESGRVFPGADREDVFGETWPCNTLSRDGGRQHACEAAGVNCDVDRYAGCRANDPARVTDAWETERTRRLPKLDDDNDEDVTFYIQDDDGAVYRIIYHAVQVVTAAAAAALDVATAPEVGDRRVPVRIEVHCESGCSSFVDSERYVVFDKRDEMVYWEPGEGVRRTAPGTAFFGPASRQANAGNSGLEQNGDSDSVGGVNLLVDTLPDPKGRGAEYALGDLIPFDWESNRAVELRARMAPNTLLPGQSGRPDFQAATYLTDHRATRLAPKDPQSYLMDAGDAAAAAAYAALPAAERNVVESLFRPMVPRGGTPSGSAVQQFRQWLTQWLGPALDATDGDPNLQCRRIYLVLLSDGLASDGKAACAQAASLRSITVAGQTFEVRTFGIAFGRRAEDYEEEKAITGRENVFECIADDGGTDTDDDLNGDGVADGPGVLFPQNKDELIQALLDAIDLVRPKPRTLTGVAVPSVQAEAADKVFLTDFTPLNSKPAWPGKVHAFVKPLPLDDEDRPDFDALCSDLPAGEPPSACYIGDLAQVVVAEQAKPSASDPVGNGATQRRVYYSLFQDPRGDADAGAVPRQRLFLEPIEVATTPQVRNDLLFGFALDPADADAVARANQTVADLLAVKTATLPDGSAIDYVIGDVFHADPLLIGAPTNNTFFIQDAGDDQSLACDSGNRGYRCFARRHATRRRVLLVGSNDGMLHGFDVGAFVRDADRLPLGGYFDNGTGREMFAYVPRPVLPKLRQVYESGRHAFTVDGQLTAADVFIDPQHSVQLSQPPDADQRQWRTVVIGGLRRGGGAPADLELPALPASLPSDAVEREKAIERYDAQEASGYYALDVTQPDPLSSTDDLPDVPAGGQPGCSGDGGGASPAAGCDGAYAMPLWEFSDSFRGILVDEDNPKDGLADLAPTWSTVNMGRMQVCVSDCGLVSQQIEDRYVAVFGGGIDPQRPGRGHWLYVVDVETSEILYKRALEGEVPAEPAAVDIDLDGYLDRIYVGTTEGYLYRVDLRPLSGGTVVYPALTTVASPITVTGRTLQDLDGDGTFEPVSYDWSPKRITGFRFDPVKLFDTGQDDGERRPIFYRAAVFYVPEINQFAVAFGTGQREDLFSRDQPSGRFFTFVDEVEDLTTLASPMGPDDLVPIDRDLAVNGQTDNLLLSRPSGQRGWWIDLGLNERLITDPFALAGILIFSSYQPTGLDPSAGSLCREQGQSRIFGVLSTNGNGIMRTSGTRSRYISSNDFVTSPFTEQAQTKNPPKSGDQNRKTADQLTDNLRQVMNELRGLFPPSCRFQEGYRIDVKARASDTGMIFIAPVPICVVEKNFKEWDTQ